MGGKGKQMTESTVTQQNIPEEFYPYFDRLLARAEEESLQPYTPYGAPRLSGTTADTEAAYGMIRDVAGRDMPGRDLATSVAAGNVGRTGELLGSSSPYQFSQYGGTQAADFSEYNYSPLQMFDASLAQSYMDPYMQSVLDIEKRKAMEDYDISRASRNAAATAAGAFGGSRQQVGESLAERDMLTRMSDIQAKGLQQSYADAVRRFEADRLAAFDRDQAAAAERSRVQAGRAGEAGRVQGLEASEVARVQAAQAQELQNYLRQQAELMQFGADQAGMVAKLEEAARSGDIQAAQLLETIGKAQQAQTQAGLDLAYEDFLRQQGYNKEQLGFISSVLHGLPLAPAGTETQLVPYNPIQQALGAGLAGLSLYKGFQ